MFFPQEGTLRKSYAYHYWSNTTQHVHHMITSNCPEIFSSRLTWPCKNILCMNIKRGKYSVAASPFLILILRLNLLPQKIMTHIFLLKRNLILFPPIFRFCLNYFCCSAVWWPHWGFRYDTFWNGFFFSRHHFFVYTKKLFRGKTLKIIATILDQIKLIRIAFELNKD